MIDIILNMAGGWSLRAEPASAEMGHIVPVFFDREGNRKTPMDAALSEYAVPIFRSIKKWLDIADERMAFGAMQEPAWKAADKAKLAMQILMQQIGNFDPTMLDTELDPHEAADA